MSFTLLGILNSQAAGGGAAGAFDLLESYTATTTGSVLFTDLPQNYKHLQIRISSRGTGGALTGDVYFRLNEDSGANYGIQSINTGYFSGSTVFSTGISIVQTRMSLYKMYDGAAVPSDGYTAATVDLLDYSSTAKTKSTMFQSGGYWITNGATPPYRNIHYGRHSWNNTDPVTSIRVYTEAIGSTVSIYGRG